MTTRDRVYGIILEHDTPAGRAFDVVLIIAILTSIAGRCGTRLGEAT